MSKKAIAIIKKCLKTKDAHLDLGNCGLTDRYVAEGTEVDNLLRQCTHLHTLILSTDWFDPFHNSSKNTGKPNYFTTHLSALQYLPELTKLVCAGTVDQPWMIQDMGWVATLRNLQELNLSFNKIYELKGLEHLPDLQLLDLSDNQISELKGLEALSNLQLFDISNNLVAELKGLESLINLQQLYIYNNRIVELKGLESLTNLQQLSTSYNLIAELKGLESLTNLKQLSINDNKIIELKGLESLTNLEQLYIARNHISELKGLESLISLQELSIYNNRIAELRGLESLYNLQKLSIHNNQITELRGIESLTDLQELSVSNNQLADITPLLQIPGFRNGKLSYDIESNPITTPPIEIVKQGREATISYLEQQSRKVWISKMALVGEGKVGKSTLLSALLGEPFMENRPTTHGMNIAQLHINHPDGNNLMSLNVWDFGGQDIYHSTHQFYHSADSLFVLVWNARIGFEAGKLYRWLEVIQSFAPEAPVIIVATETEERGSDLPKGDILARFSSDITFVDVDSRTAKGIDTLLQKIAEKSAALKYMGEPQPISWINAIDAIKQESGWYTTKDRIIDILSENKVPVTTQEGLLQYLHTMGEILYFPNDDELKNTIILKPVWVSEQVAKILDSEELSANAGWLKKELMEKLWTDVEPDVQYKLIRLMENFDLSYRTEDNDEISLVVEKLNWQEPETYMQDWHDRKGQNEIIFRYQLDTIPPGIPTWFVARTHRFTTKVQWKNGVVLSDNKGSIGFLHVSRESKQIWLKVRGQMPYYFFALLRDAIELTLSRFSGLKTNISIPCWGHGGTPCTHFFDLKQLEGRLIAHKPRPIIECPVGAMSGAEDLDVPKLLFGLSFAPGDTKLTEMSVEQIRKVIAEENEKQNEDLKKLWQLDFLKLYHAVQEIQDQTCPNIFLLSEEIADGLNTDIVFIHYKMHLCCQAPGHIHTVGEPYTIKVPREWIKAVAPYYNGLLKMLKLTMPVLIPATKDVLDKISYESIEAHLELTKGSVDVLTDGKSHNSFDLEIPGKDMPIRHIRQILDKADPKMEWRGLQRTITPEGHILWLCPQHYHEYRR